MERENELIALLAGDLDPGKIPERAEGERLQMYEIIDMALSHPAPVESDQKLYNELQAYPESKRTYLAIAAIRVMEAIVGGNFKLWGEYEKIAQGRERLELQKKKLERLSSKTPENLPEGYATLAELLMHPRRPRTFEEIEKGTVRDEYATEHEVEELLRGDTYAGTEHA
ncbi:MAG: hypothetical protein IJ083_09225 [Clostridia bacterium]|nr:hypothetical protein [Clostridia bacterium]